MTELAFVIPTLGRAPTLPPLVENIAETTPVEHRVLFVVDSDDEATWDVLDKLIPIRPHVCGLEFDGGYVSSTNAGVKATTEPLVMLSNDDVRYHPGWYEAATAKLTDGIGVVGTNDLHNREVLAGVYATQMLVTREYIKRGTIDEPNAVFHSGYHHNACDRELCETAKSRGAWAMAMDSHVEHLHPTYGLNEIDETYRIGCYAPSRDEALYRERRALWAV